MAKEIPGMHFIGEVTQKVLLEKEGKVLLCQDLIDVEAENWDLPGGRLHRGEAPLDGLAREVEEELGVRITAPHPLYVGVLEKPASSDTPRFVLIYGATLADPERDFVLAPDEIMSVRWVGKDEIASIKIWEVLKDIVVGHLKGF